MRNRPLKDVALRVYERVPATRKALHVINDALHPPAFSGWGMTTHHAAPWEDARDWAHFRDALAHVRTQFAHGLQADTAVTPGIVDTLRWRHWIVSCTARYACRFAEGSVSLVECGVGDGLTAYFACDEAEQQRVDYTLDCYDTWAPVQIDDPGRDYADLSLERTRRNLARFDGRVRYHQGLIPGVLQEAAPELVHYLSIDLNAAAPTVATLNHFLPRLADRAVVLFDDYGHVGYERTRRAIDDFVATQRGVLMKLPTGQAVYYV